VYGDDFHQLVAKDHLPKGSITIKATIKKYSHEYGGICFGLLTNSRRNEKDSGGHQ